MLKGFELELYCISELVQYCSYMSHIYEFYSINRNMHVFTIAGGTALGQKIVNQVDLKNSSDKFNQIRENLSFS